MIRYVTLHLIKEMNDDPDSKVTVDITLADSNNPYPDTEVIKSIIRSGYQIKGDAVERYLRLISAKIARYAFKAYPFVLSIKFRILAGDGEYIESTLEETEVTDQEVL